MNAMQRPFVCTDVLYELHNNLFQWLWSEEAMSVSHTGETKKKKGMLLRLQNERV